MADGGYVLRSYQYLRVTMVLLLTSLAVSVLVELGRVGFDCFQGSISAYYYTPVRPIFVSALIATGCCMVAIRARDDSEDVLFNVAGMLAVIVALVPTGPPELGCPTDGSKIDRTVDTASYVSNNVPALFVTGAVACVAAYMLAGAGRRATILEEQRTIVRGLAFTAVAIVAGFGWYLVDQDSFLRKAHGSAAVAMFVFIGLVVKRNIGRATGGYRRWYQGIVATMIGAALIVGIAAGVVRLADGSWRHAVLMIEILEIIPFLAFWIVQTAEHWQQRSLDVAA